MAISEASSLAHRVTFYVLIGCWWAFALTFWLRKQPPPTQDVKCDRSSLLGLLLQAAAYSIIWFYPMQQRQFSAVADGSRAMARGVAALTIVIAIGSVWLVNAAARRLGKQWALTARVVEGHTLIQDGPYRFVRNPIYTGMFGMLLATGVAAGQWKALLAASVLFLAGTHIRVRSEERLLCHAFGREFETYRRKVAALIPGVY